MQDNVHHPGHYTAGGVECIDALKAATVGLEGIDAVCTANAIKYLWRWKRKNGVEDLEKAVWYIERLIKEQKERDTMNHKQYMKAREDIMTVCCCNEEKAQAILNRVASLGGRVDAFASHLPEMMQQAVPDPDDVITQLDQIAADKGKLDQGFGSFTLPVGYENRDARRKNERQTKRRKQKPVFRYHGRR